MMAEKRDWLGDCNDQGVPLEDFRLQFCERCLQPECTRSQHGKSQFDARVADWESRLFLDVPRMDKSDPRYEDLQAKRFLGIDTSRVPEVQSWVDPRDLQQPTPKKPEPVPEPALVPEPPPEYEMPETKQVEAQAVADIEEQGPAEPEPVPLPAVETPQRAALNTPNQPGQMLGGKKVDEKPVAPVSDPWVPKESTPTPDDLKVVPPGAKIRLGGSGV